MNKEKLDAFDQSAHVSAETAHVTADYPYGFRLRCQRREWVETSKFGQRFVTQTSNPKAKALVWNKPKAGTYHRVCVLGRDAEGHVAIDVLSVGSGEKEIREFAERYSAALTEYQREQVRFLLAMALGAKHITWEVSTAKPGEQGQTPEEQREIARQGFLLGLAELKREESR